MNTKPNCDAMRQSTLFDTEHDKAVFDMIERFNEQLRAARTAHEAEMVREAIRGWASTLGPALPNMPPNRGAKTLKHALK